ncbi:MAG: hypothetical protein AAB879_02965, partial [Patescibacteria group bacterium]
MKFPAMVFFNLLTIGCFKDPSIHSRSLLPRTTPTTSAAVPQSRLVPVKWIDVHTKKQFWETINAHPRIVVLFGSTSCAPCHTAKAWWEKQTAPEGWTFAYWEWKNDDDPDDHEDHGVITRSFLVYNPDKTSFPI